ncbi:ABC transporter I family member 6 [Populus alba x Populus x berolinensis]|nr:ABC transporter I family member 6 [Populus alba x Populus x berolinensis]
MALRFTLSSPSPSLQPPLIHSPPPLKLSTLPLNSNLFTYSATRSLRLRSTRRLPAVTASVPAVENHRDNWNRFREEKAVAGSQGFDRFETGDSQRRQRLSFYEGEVHAIMGKNGSGKSTFSKVLAGHPDYEVTGGSVVFKGENLLDMEPEESHQLRFLVLTILIFLIWLTMREDGNSVLPELGPIEFYAYLFPKLELVNMKSDFLNRKRFSGGERKRNEILQLAVLGAELAILDEIDSGLDIDALQDVAKAVNGMLTPNNAVLMITHISTASGIQSSPRAFISWRMAELSIFDKKDYDVIPLEEWHCLYKNLQTLSSNDKLVIRTFNVNASMEEKQRDLETTRRHEMLVPQTDLADGPQPMEVAQAETATAVDAQSVDDPPSARFTWTIDNFSRLNARSSTLMFLLLEATSGGY